VRDAEEMITMTVCDIDRGQVLAASGNPVGENPVLVNGQQSVDEDGIASAINESCRTANPLQMFPARREVTGDSLPLGHEDVPVQENPFARRFIHYCTP
jgi:hypothetical protein